jgi:methylmalonyl-CoA/ethylmalonyl-CoA epimerase
MSNPVFVDHIAFLVRSLDDALTDLPELESQAQPIQSFAAEGTRECYLGEARTPGRLLLIEPISDGPYAKALAKRGPGLHHVGLAVVDLDAFIADAVAGSGWLVHPRSFETRRASNIVWLCRPGVEALIECMQTDEAPSGEPAVEQLSIAGLDSSPGLASIFSGSGVEVVAGAKSGVKLHGRFVG